MSRTPVMKPLPSRRGIVPTQRIQHTSPHTEVAVARPQVSGRGPIRLSLPTTSDETSGGGFDLQTAFKALQAMPATTQSAHLLDFFAEYASQTRNPGMQTAFKSLQRSQCVSEPLPTPYEEPPLSYKYTVSPAPQELCDQAESSIESYGYLQDTTDYGEHLLCLLQKLLKPLRYIRDNVKCNYTFIDLLKTIVRKVRGLLSGGELCTREFLNQALDSLTEVQIQQIHDQSTSLHYHEVMCHEPGCEEFSREESPNEQTHEWATVTTQVVDNLRIFIKALLSSHGEPKSLCQTAIETMQDHLTQIEDDLQQHRGFLDFGPINFDLYSKCVKAFSDNAMTIYGHGHESLFRENLEVISFEGFCHLFEDFMQRVGFGFLPNVPKMCVLQSLIGQLTGGLRSRFEQLLSFVESHSSQEDLDAAQNLQMLQSLTVSTSLVPPPPQVEVSPPPPQVEVSPPPQVEVSPPPQVEVSQDSEQVEVSQVEVPQTDEEEREMVFWG